jgi:hypothetical protein
MISSGERNWDKYCSAHGSCVEVAVSEDGVAMRATGSPDVVIETFTLDADWAGFLAGVKQGDFD